MQSANIIFILLLFSYLSYIPNILLLFKFTINYYDIIFNFSFPLFLDYNFLVYSYILSVACHSGITCNREIQMGL
jgi:hypothetical protein